MRGNLEEAIAAARPQLGGVVEHRAAGPVGVRMRGGELPGGLIRPHPGRLQGARVELHRKRRLGHRDEALAELGHVDVGVVGQYAAAAEQRLHALEQRTAGVGGELAVDHLALLA